MTLMYKIFNSASEGSGATIIFSDGLIQQLPQDNANFAQVVSILTTTPVDAIDEDALKNLIAPALGVNKSLTRLSERVTFDGSNILFDGDVVSDAIADHILRIIKEGGNTDSYKALVAFMEKLYTNPSESSRNSLYDFIVRHNITIDPDGDFYAYKGVKADGGSIKEGFGIVDGASMNGSLPNKPGSILEIPRSHVDANNKNGCGIGLHAGTYGYAKGWSRGMLLLVKINPRDVVSVPDCSSYQKIRTCRYKVVTQTVEQNTATTATVEVMTEADPLSNLAALVKAGATVPANFTYTRGNGETINVSLTVSEVRHNGKNETIVIGKDTDGETRSYRSKYISELTVGKDSILNRMGITSAKVASPAASTPDVVGTPLEVALLRTSLELGETVLIDFNYTTVDGEARTVKNFEANALRTAACGQKLVTGVREDGETRTYRLDRMTDVEVQDNKAPSVTAPSVAVNPYASLVISISNGEKVTVSFDYTKINGESRSVKNFVAEELKTWGNELLVGVREDGETRTYRVDHIKNLVIHSADDEGSEDIVPAQKSSVDYDAIQKAIVVVQPVDAAHALKSFVLAGSFVTVSFDYTTVDGESRSVKNFVAQSVKTSRPGISDALLIGEREDGETRSYRFDRIENVVIHRVS